MMENRMSREYELGVEAFIQFGFRHAKGSSTIRCPCLKCGNRLPQDESTVRYHLYANGIDQSYKIWFWHGESFTSETSCNRQAYTNEETVDDNLFHVINMVQNVPISFLKYLIRLTICSMMQRSLYFLVVKDSQSYQH